MDAPSLERFKIERGPEKGGWNQMVSKDPINPSHSVMFQLFMNTVCTESKPLLLLTLPHQRVGWRCTKKLGWDTAGRTDPN